jgi:hypothetical protein
MKPSEVLLAARELVAGGFSQAAFARDAGGDVIYCHDPGAESFCMLGAARKVSCDAPVYDDARRFLMRVTNGDATRFNDTHTHLEVTVCLERAALLAMKEGR